MVQALAPRNPISEPCIKKNRSDSIRRRALFAAQRPKMAAINTTKSRTLPIKPTPHNASPHSSWRSLDRPSLPAVFEALMHPNYPKNRKRDWTFG